jgi:hypothetical protein
MNTYIQAPEIVFVGPINHGKAAVIESFVGHYLFDPKDIHFQRFFLFFQFHFLALPTLKLNQYQFVIFTHRLALFLFEYSLTPAHVGQQRDPFTSNSPATPTALNPALPSSVITHRRPSMLTHAWTLRTSPLSSPREIRNHKFLL